MNLKNIVNALFGKPFDITTATPTEELLQKKKDILDNADIGNSDAVLQKLNQYFSVSLDSVGRYTDYRLMEISAPEVSKAISYMASYYAGFTFINTEDKLLELQIQSLLDLWFDYMQKNHQSLYGMIRNLLKYGDLFIEPAYIKLPKKEYDNLQKRVQELVKKNAEQLNYKLKAGETKILTEVLLNPKKEDEYYRILGGFKYYDPDFFEIALYIDDSNSQLNPDTINKIGDLFNQLQTVFDNKTNDKNVFDNIINQINENQTNDFLKEGKLYILKRKFPVKPEPSRELAHFSSSMTPMPTVYYNPSAKRFGNLRIIMGTEEMAEVKKDYFIYRYNEDMYHLGLFVDLYRPYGTSILDSARLAWKKMELLEEILILRRLMSLKRGWWKITFPTRVSRTKVAFTVQDIVNRIKKVELPDTNKKDMHSFPLLWGLTDEIVVPVTANEYDLTYEEFGPQGGEFNKEIEEYTQLRDRFYNGLFIPKNLLKAIRDGEVISADIVSQDKLFKEIGKQVRKLVTQFLEKLIIQFFEDRSITISEFNLVLFQLEEIEEIMDLVGKVADIVDIHKILKSMGVESILKAKVKKEE